MSAKQMGGIVNIAATIAKCDSARAQELKNQGTVMPLGSNHSQTLTQRTPLKSGKWPVARR